MCAGNRAALSLGCSSEAGGSSPSLLQTCYRCLGPAEMEKVERIAVLDDEIQARLLEAVLKERGVPHAMQSYFSIAYDGLFQLASGWGHVEAPGRYREEILAALREIRETPPLSDGDPRDS